MATNQTKKAAPLMGCMTVVASNQMNCITMPMAAEPSEIYRKVPPAFHWYRAATIKPNPAAVNPIFPVSHRR